MTIPELLDDLRTRDIELWADGDELRYSAPTGALTPELRVQLAGRKADIMAFLRAIEAQAPPLSQVSREETLPLSFAQERLWFLDQLEPGSTAYNLPMALRLTGRLSVEALERSLNEIVRRHEVLRTTFVAQGGEPVQAIAPTLSLDLPIRDLAGIPDAEQETEARRLAKEEGQRPFDLSRGPLLRCALLRLHEQHHVLLITIHHIVSDGWSRGLFYRELSTLYEAYSHDRPSSLPELPIQYADFAVWQREWLHGEVLEAQLSYWGRQLAGAPPLLDLPTDRPRPAVRSFPGARRSETVPAALSQRLKALSREEGATLFMTLLAAFKVLLNRYTGIHDILVGTPIANRNRAEIEGLIGFFVNTLVLRSDLSGDPTFRELVAQVRETCLEAYAHQDLPFEKLVGELQPERSLSQSPLFQVMFALQNVPRRSLELSGLKVRWLATGGETAMFDLSLVVYEVGDALRVSFQFNTDLFDATTSDRMMGHYRTLLEAAVADPDGRISSMPLLTEAERYQLLVEWNNTQADYPENLFIQDLFEAQVERTPEAVALRFEDQQLTYGELNARANQLAHYLRERGVGPEKLVGVCMKHCLEAPVAILGILKAGAAWLPLDPTYPSRRLAFMIEDSGVSPLVIQHELEDLVRSAGAEDCLSLDLDEMPPEVTRQPSTNVTVRGLSPDNLAYVLYTSGTTGRPRGVLVQHQGVVNVVWYRAFKLLGAETLRSAVLQSSLSFDASVVALFVPLAAGGTVRVVRDLPELGRLLGADATTYLLLTPSTLETLMADTTIPGSVEAIGVGGEAVSEQLVQRVRSHSSAGRLINFYGPTEASIACTDGALMDRRSEPREHGRGRPVDRQQGPVTIGKPTPNMRAYILDSHLEPVPVGVTGELHFSGAGLARGYLGRPALTGEKFVPDPFTSRPGARLYKTGDLARSLPDGRIEFLGRRDHQVKVRGFRIELGEIETVLAMHPSVRQAVVLARANGRGAQSARVADKRLVAYIVPETETPVTVTEVRRYLAERLPDYLIPSAFVTLKDVPLTASGKVDVRALPAPGGGRPELEEVFVAPRNGVESGLASIWSELLGVEPIGVHDNFFELGGHSLLAIRVVSQIGAALRVETALRWIFEAPTIAQLAQRIEQEGELGIASCPPLLSRSRVRDTG